jgi:PhzF family phenazine biosynthesis protein
VSVVETVSFLHGFEIRIMAGLKLQFLTTDVFTSTRYEGNPLAIVRLPKSQKLTQEQKQRIAKEFNLSETVILHESEEGYRKLEWTFDIFVTYREIPFAGHPTIGTICYLGRSLQAGSSGGSIEGVLNCKAGRIPWTFDPASGRAICDIPHDSHLHAKSLDSRGLQALGVPDAVTNGLVNSAPIVSIVKGMTACLIEMSTLEFLGAVTPGYKRPGPEGQTAEYLANGLAIFYFYHLTTDKTLDGALKVRTRMVMGNEEDPATGSAASALAVYLAKHHPKLRQPKEKTHKFEFTQGVEMGRKSVIGIDVHLDEAAKVEKVVLSGSAVEVMEGNIAV